MNNDLIEKIELQVKQSLSDITGEVTPNIEVYEDVALLEYEFEQPRDMEDVLDSIEDDMGLAVLYYARKTNGQAVIHHACAVCSPSGYYMFKVNCISDEEDNVSMLTITIFSSIELMNNDLQTDLTNHYDNGFEFIDLMEDGVYAAMFTV